MMQAHHQHYPLSLPFPHPSLSSPGIVVEPDFANGASTATTTTLYLDGLDPDSFSRGSSSSSSIYPNPAEMHDYFTDRGASLTSHPEYLADLSILPSLSVGESCATGEIISGVAHSGGGITGLTGFGHVKRDSTHNNNDNNGQRLAEMFATEDVPGYLHLNHVQRCQEWEWERHLGNVRNIIRCSPQAHQAQPQAHGVGTTPPPPPPPQPATTSSPAAGALLLSPASVQAADTFGTVKSPLYQSPPPLHPLPSALTLLPSPTSTSTPQLSPPLMAITLQPRAPHGRGRVITGRLGVQPQHHQASTALPPLSAHPLPHHHVVHVNERSETGDPDIDVLQQQRHLHPHPHSPADQQQQQPEVIDGPLRERKHGCTMCHKRFDRPSTLRKHLLVHTGEKAFVCDTCGRRFGVASNLNRHAKKCILKPVNAPKTSSSRTSPDPDSQTHTSSGSLSENQNQSAENQSAAGSVTSARGRGTQPQGPRDHNAPKRRRRAPSPSRWVPPSLLNFVLQCPEAQKSCPVPLPPVRRALPAEERDSYEYDELEDVDATPYHPRGWKDVLPGPGLTLPMTFGGRAGRNLNLGGGNGGFMGRVMVF